MDPFAMYDDCEFTNSQGTQTGIESWKKGIEYCDYKFPDSSDYEEKYDCYAT